MTLNEFVGWMCEREGTIQFVKTEVFASTLALVPRTNHGIQIGVTAMYDDESGLSTKHDVKAFPIWESTEEVDITDVLLYWGDAVKRQVEELERR